MTTRRTPAQALASLRRILGSPRNPHEVADAVLALAGDLPDGAIAVMDEALTRSHPLVRVALIDAYFTMTGCDWHLDDLDELARGAAREKDDDLLAAASIAAARQAGEPEGVWVSRGVEIVGVARRRPSGPRRRKTLARPGAAQTITIVIHGTWARDGRWWRRGGDFFEYLRSEGGVEDLFDTPDRFEWSGDNLDFSRTRASLDLHDWIAGHGAAAVRVIGHSHGANVAALATRRGTRIDRLVMLSPPVRRDYLPDWSRVGRAFNVQAKFDAVVAVARGVSWFRDVADDPPVREKRLRVCGHSMSHAPDVWRSEGLARFVGLPW